MLQAQPPLIIITRKIITIKMEMIQKMYLLLLRYLVKSQVKERNCLALRLLQMIVASSAIDVDSAIQLEESDRSTILS